MTPLFLLGSPSRRSSGRVAFASLSFSKFAFSQNSRSGRIHAALQLAFGFTHHLRTI